MLTTDYLIILYQLLSVWSCAWMTCDRCHVVRYHVMVCSRDRQTTCCVGGQFKTAPTPYLNLVPQLLALYYHFLVIYVLTPFLMGMRVFSWLPVHNDTERSCRTKGEVEMWVEVKIKLRSNILMGPNLNPNPVKLGVELGLSLVELGYELQVKLGIFETP